MLAEQHSPSGLEVADPTASKAARWAGPEPGQLLAVALAGAAVLLAVQSVLLALFTHASVWQTSWVIAAVFMGRAVLHWPAVFDFAAITAAVTAIYPTALVCGIILCGVGRRLTLKEAILAGALVGLLFCPVDLYGLTGLFPWLVEERHWMTLLSYLVMGGVMAWRLQRAGEEFP